MSTSRTPDGISYHEICAPHVGPEFHQVRDMFHDALLGSTALGFIAHYGGGQFDFSLDRLDEPQPEPDALPGGTRREELQRFGRIFGFDLQWLDRLLREVGSGALIRVVLQTENGAAFATPVVPGEHVVGLVLDGVPAHRVGPVPDAEVHAADRTVSVLATKLRRLIDLGTQNLGGFETAPLEPAEVDTESVGGAITVHSEHTARARTLENLCTGAVNPADLHLIALYSAGKTELMVDCLNDGSLSAFFTNIRASARRTFYQGFGQELDALVVRINRTTRQVLGGLLHRVVLDIEQGAIYCYRMGTGVYLVGVTLSQKQVHLADNRMAKLAVVARDLLAG